MTSIVLRMCALSAAIVLLALPNSSRAAEPTKRPAKVQISADKLYRTSNVSSTGHVLVLTWDGKLFDLDLNRLAVALVHDYKSYEAIANADISFSDDGKTIAIFRCAAAVVEILESENSAWKIKASRKFMEGYAFGAVYLPPEQGVVHVVVPCQAEEDSGVYFCVVPWKYKEPLAPSKQLMWKFGEQFVFSAMGDAKGERVVVGGFHGTRIFPMKEDEEKFVELSQSGGIRVSPNKELIAIVGPARIGLRNTTPRFTIVDFRGNLRGEFEVRGIASFSADSQSLLMIDEKHRIARFGFDGKPVGEPGEVVADCKLLIPTSAARSVALIEDEGLWAVEVPNPPEELKR